MIQARIASGRTPPPGEPVASGARAAGSSLDDARWFLAHSAISIGPRDRFVIAGVVRPATVADLEPSATVDVLLPHDALAVIERSDPDLVLVESAALSSGGPWAHAGDPSVADLARRLFDLLVAARSLGRPTVLWWNSPRSAAPGLIALGSLFSLVLGTDPPGDDEIVVPWTPGVQLSRSNDLDLDPDRPMRPVFAGRWDPAAPRRSRSFATMTLESLTATGLDIWLEDDADRRWLPDRLRQHVTRRIDPRDSDAPYRERGLFLADPLTHVGSGGSVASSTLKQLASGARVVSGPNDGLAASFTEGVTWMAAPSEAPMAVRDAIERGPLPAGERRRIKRILFERHAADIAVADLAKYLGLRAHPSRAREACAVVQLGRGVRGDAFVDSILRQRHRPSEAVIVCDDPSEARVSVAELEAAGVAARSMAPNAAGRYALRDVAATTAAGWLWTWSPVRRLEPGILLDLMVGAAMSGADAVGWVDAHGDGFSDALPVEGSIVARRAALARPDPIDGALGPWTRRGGRLFGLGIGVDARSDGER